MSYSAAEYGGIIAPIRVGRGGLLTDESQLDIPDTHLTKAMNISLANGILQKEPGSFRWNTSAFAAGIAAMIDWFPEEHLQRFLVVTKNGKVYKCPDRETQTEVTASGSAPSSLILSDPPQIVLGGAESAGRSRKAFIFTKNSPIQVISGDAIIRTNLSTPSADWSTSNYPVSGVIHRNRLWVFGGDPHRAYASDPANHENFTSNHLQFQVYPGEGEAFTHGVVYKGRLFAFKKPLGVYILEDSDTNTSNWFFRKISSELGGTGPDSSFEALNDFLISDSAGSVTSLRAVEQLGDVAAGSVFNILKVENYIRSLMSVENLVQRKAIYYSDKKIGFVSFQSIGGIRPDRIFKIDFSRQHPNLTILSAFQPNCFAERKTVFGKRPFYGAEDGYIYELDRPNRNVADSGYEGRFMTPHLDFRYLDPRMGMMNKNFDFIEFVIYPTGRWNLTFKYYIDGIPQGSPGSASMSFGAVLDDFEIDEDWLSGNTPYVVRKELRGSGRTFALEAYNSGTNENFKIAEIRVGFRLGNEDQKIINSGRT